MQDVNLVAREDEQLRVAIITAGLDTAGAEKQAFYMTRSLAEAGICVRVYQIEPGGLYHRALCRMHIECKWFGRLPTPFLRLPHLLAYLRTFRPHVIQSIHAYTNLYSAIAGKVLKAVSVGGLRGDLEAFFADHGRFSRFLLRGPDAVAANSRKAVEEIIQGELLDSQRIYLLPNAIDLQPFPERIASGGRTNCACISAGRLIPGKRFDVFLRALAQARVVEPSLKGIIAGDGPELEKLRNLAAELNLLPGGVDFLGLREDMAAVLQQQQGMFVLCSESEGTPNVILEGMAAGLPVITTPAGDAAEVVEAAGAGFVIPFGDIEQTACAILRLATAPALREKLGRAGRSYVARERSTGELGPRLLKMYAAVARNSTRRYRRGLLDRLSRCPEL